jgi:hypothetical protein
MSTDSKTSILNDLEQRDAELQSAIADHVRSGGDSMKLRQELSIVQQQLQAARADVASMHAAGRKAAASATTKLGDELAGAAIDRIVGGAAPFAAILAACPDIPDFNGAPALQIAMHNVVAARTRATEAEAAHAEVDELSRKAAAKRKRHAELSHQRVTGEAGDGSAAEMYAAGEDVRTLDSMHATAKAKADILVQPVHDARIALKYTEQQASTIEHRLAAEYLADHAKALDAALIACLRACQSEGAKDGVGIGALAKVSLELRTYVSIGVLPAPFRRA